MTASAILSCKQPRGDDSPAVGGGGEEEDNLSSEGLISRRSQTLGPADLPVWC